MSQRIREFGRTARTDEVVRAEQLMKHYHRMVRVLFVIALLSIAPLFVFVWFRIEMADPVAFIAVCGLPVVGLSMYCWFAKRRWYHAYLSAWTSRGGSLEDAHANWRARNPIRPAIPEGLDAFYGHRSF